LEWRDCTQSDIVMVYANYHTHTFRCRHASGSEREYIENAIKGGIKLLGFSDHAPYIFKDGYYSTYRMRPEETEDYFRTVLDLKEEYKDDVEIHAGLEIEYYERYFEDTIRFIENFPCEYLILGQHNLDSENGPLTKYPGLPTSDPRVFRMYIDEAIAGIETGKFIYLAHPDLCPFTGDPAIYDAEYRRLCETLKKYDMPGEINLLGVREGRRYPSERFWRIAAETGIRTLIGVDAHCPEALSDEACCEKAVGLADKFGLKPENLGCAPFLL